MRLLTLVFMLPSLCSAAWVASPVVDPAGGRGFEVLEDGVFVYEVPALYTDTHALFFFADFISDGYVAGHAQPMQSRGADWITWADPIAFTADRFGAVDLWEAGTPTWMNTTSRWACVDGAGGAGSFLVNAQSLSRKDIAVSCAEVVPSSVPEPDTAALLAAGATALAAGAAWQAHKRALKAPARSA